MKRCPNGKYEKRHNRVFVIYEGVNTGRLKRFALENRHNTTTAFTWNVVPKELETLDYEGGILRGDEDEREGSRFDDEQNVAHWREVTVRSFSKYPT